MLRRLGVLAGAVVGLAGLRRQRAGRAHYTAAQPDPDLRLRLEADGLVDDVDARSVRHDRRLPARHRRPHRRHRHVKYVSGSSAQHPDRPADLRPPLRRPRPRAAAPLRHLHVLGAPPTTTSGRAACLVKLGDEYIDVRPVLVGPVLGLRRARGHPPHDDPVIYRALARRLRRSTSRSAACSCGATARPRHVTGSHQRRGAMSSCIFCGP